MTQIASQEDVDKILKAFYLVYNTLGYGFLERVYQNALYFELIEQGFKCEVQKQINVFYKNHKVGEYLCRHGDQQLHHIRTESG